jgi:glucosamine--fructose-6-phosphate aminotransferase (isomerizing)
MSDTKLYQSIRRQPQAIRELLADSAPIEASTQLLREAKRILCVGIGTSYHAAMIGSYLLRQAGAEAWAIHAFEFTTYPRKLQKGDLILSISHRGNKHYSSQVLQMAEKAGIPTICITGKNTKAQHTQAIIETVEQDPSSAHTISYIASLTRLAQLATKLAEQNGEQEIAQQFEQGLAKLPGAIEDVLRCEGEIAQVAQEAIANKRRIYLIGAGPNAVTAQEGALKVKETAYVTVEGFELEQGIHGPMMAFEQEDLLIPIHVQGAATERMGDFMAVLSEMGTHTWVVGGIPQAAQGFLQHPTWQQFTLDYEGIPETLTPMLTIIPLQLLADFLAQERGTNADGFRLEQEAYKRAYGRIQL